MQTSNHNCYKVIFSDIDGTLLNKDRDLSSATIDEVKRITNNHDIQFVLVSARMPSGIKYLYNQLSISSPVICYNGALIISFISNECFSVLDSNSIDYDVVSWLIDKSKELELHCSIYSNDSWVTEKLDEWTLREQNNTKTIATLSDLKNTYTSWIDSKRHIHKVMIMGEPEKIARFYSDANGLHSNQVNIYRSKNTYLEISPKIISKSSACSFILDKLNVHKNEAIAFGDNYNDIEMLSMVKLGVAMGNAIDEVKNAADIVAPSNISDGVAAVIKELFK